ncbi:MAG TPA: S49 family peptidase [Polyangiaceae bacterium]|nr:S49 family peptidase [Polyangiaceae bacterium]
MTEDLAASHGGEVICLHPLAIGQRYRLFASRQGPEQNVRLARDAFGVPRTTALYGSRADVISPNGEVTELDIDPDEAPIVTRVDIQGPLEQRAGYYDPCAGWTDGHDALAERMIAALEEGDVLMVIDSPGGAHAGLEEAVRRVVEAKEEHGRHVIAYADEMIGSAAYWWAACVADEIYGPKSMIVGSIGARAGHGSIAGALAKEGVEVTYFAWPGEGKVAFAPELPLSDVGRMRGNRDVAMAGESFAASVGPRRGMTRDEIVELDADALHGVLALNAKLVDGIASLEDVMEYALALAAPEQPGENDDMKTKNRPAKPGVTAATRSEDPKKKEPDAPEAAEPETPPAADKHECGKCGAANDDDAKYCDKCGEPLDGRAAEDPDGEKEPKESRAESDDDDDDDDDDDKKGKDKGKGDRAEPPPEERRAAAPSHAGSLAAIFGLRDGASHPAIKSAAIAYASLGRAVMSATGTKSPNEAQGALRSLVDDAAEAEGLRASLAASQKREVRREKMDLLTKLAAKNLAGYPRGELLVDREVGGKLVTGPAPMYDEMPIATLRGFVNGKLKGQAPAGPQRTPFDPDPNRARTSTENALVEADLGTPFIQDLASRSTASAEQLAKTARALEAQGAR